MEAAEKKNTYTAAEVAELQTTIRQQQDEIDDLKKKLGHMNEILLNAQRARFGQSSEKKTYVLGEDQISLFNEAELVQDHKAEEPTEETFTVKAHTRKKKRTIAELAKNLPVEEIVLQLPESKLNCSKCGGTFRLIGKKLVRRELVIIPQQEKILEYYSCTYACDKCEKDTGYAHILTTQAPPALMKHSLASPSTVEEALIEMYLAGVSVRRVEDITEALWGSKVSPATISELNKKAYVHIEDWRNRPLQGGKYPYVYVDGIYLRRNWGGEYENVAILVAIAVNEDGYREVLGAAEGMKEDKASWVNFFQWLKSRGLEGVKLIVGDKCLGMLEAVGEVFPDAKYQRCTVHFYRNVFSVVPRSKVKLVAKMLKAIHAQESKKAAREKAKAVVAQLREMKLKEAAKKVEDSVEETLTYCDFPYEHWTRIRTNNVIERLNREIRRRTRVVGTFPDGNSALMLVCARLRHVAGTQWGNKKYMNMKHLEAALEDVSIAG